MLDKKLDFKDYVKQYKGQEKENFCIKISKFKILSKFMILTKILTNYQGDENIYF